MNDTKINSKTTSSEPKKLYVRLESYMGNENVILMNNGVVTSKVTESGEQTKVVLQGSTAFRGFIGALTELFGYFIKSTWTDRDNQNTED